MDILLENGKTFLKGIVTEANDVHNRPRNRNGRIYTEDVLKPSIETLIETIAKDGFVLSYRNHPSHVDLVYEDSCAKLIELSWEDETSRALGKFEILEDTDDGKQVLKDIDKGIIYGNSTRATGSLDENKVVQAGLNIITSDLIPIEGTSIQSCQSCTLNLQESIQEFYSDCLLEEDMKDCACEFKSTFDGLNEDEQKVVVAGMKDILVDMVKSIK